MLQLVTRYASSCSRSHKGAFGAFVLVAEIFAPLAAADQIRIAVGTHEFHESSDVSHNRPARCA